MDFWNALSTIIVFHTALLLVKEFTANEVQEYPHVHGLYWFYHVAHHPEEADLMVEWPFEDPVTDATRWQQFAGLGNVLQETVCTQISIPCTGLFLPQLGFMVPGVEERKRNGSIQY